MKKLLAIAILLCLTSGFAQATPEEPTPALTITENWEGRNRAVLQGEHFTTFIHGSNKHEGDSHLPYFYPIHGPTGSKMTRAYPMQALPPKSGESTDHPHHRSLWFAHGSINGTDFWHKKKNSGQIKLLKTNIRKVPLLGTPYLQTLETWTTSGGEEILRCGVTTGFKAMDDGSRCIDIARTLYPAAGVDQLIFGDTKEGTMAIRLAPQLRLKGKVATGQAINSNGDKNAKVWGKRAKWVAYWGVIDGKTCGVAIFDHPTNLRHPTWWHARDYGLVAANPFGISDFEKDKHKRGAGDYTLKQGDSLNLRYRFVFFAGTAEEANVADKYDQWVKETTKHKPDAESK